MIHVQAMGGGACERLLEAGCHILIENPATSYFWSLIIVQALMKKYRLLFVIGHGCAYNYRGRQG